MSPLCRTPLAVGSCVLAIGHDGACSGQSAEERIVEIAKAMREAYCGRFCGPWERQTDKFDRADRIAWLAAAAQAARMLGREDVIPSVGPESWMAPVFGAKEKREPGCNRHCEEGDSPCPDHPLEDE
jgi:hypothetical protein